MKLFSAPNFRKYLSYANDVLEILQNLLKKNGYDWHSNMATTSWNTNIHISCQLEYFWVNIFLFRLQVTTFSLGMIYDTNMTSLWVAQHEWMRGLSYEGCGIIPVAHPTWMPCLFYYTEQSIKSIRGKMTNTRDFCYILFSIVGKLHGRFHWIRWIPLLGTTACCSMTNQDQESSLEFIIIHNSNTNTNTTTNNNNNNTGLKKSSVG